MVYGLFVVLRRLENAFGASGFHFRLEISVRLRRRVWVISLCFAQATPPVSILSQGRPRSVVRSFFEAGVEGLDGGVDGCRHWLTQPKGIVLPAW